MIKRNKDLTKCGTKMARVLSPNEKSKKRQRKSKGNIINYLRNNTLNSK